jgi:hypothetical protein
MDFTKKALSLSNHFSLGKRVILMAGYRYSDPNYMVWEATSYNHSGRGGNEQGFLGGADFQLSRHFKGTVLVDCWRNTQANPFSGRDRYQTEEVFTLLYNPDNTHTVQTKLRTRSGSGSETDFPFPRTLSFNFRYLPTPLTFLETETGSAIRPGYVKPTVYLLQDGGIKAKKIECRVRLGGYSGTGGPPKPLWEPSLTYTSESAVLTGTGFLFILSPAIKVPGLGKLEFRWRRNFPIIDGKLGPSDNRFAIQWIRTWGSSV